MKTLLRKLLITFVVLVSIPLFLFLMAIPLFYQVVATFLPIDDWAGADCIRQERGSVKSPDGAWEARVGYFSCGSGFTGYGRDFSAVAIVAPGQNPSRSNTALEVEETLPLDWRERPPVWRLNLSDLLWRDAGRLEVAVPTDVTISNQKSRVDAVTIEIRRVADSAERK